MADGCDPENLEGSASAENVMFEAAEPKVFNWYVREFGVDVNVFVDHSQVVQLACLRSGIWGIADTFGRVVSFRDGNWVFERKAIDWYLLFKLRAPYNIVNIRLIFELSYGLYNCYREYRRPPLVTRA